jgi:hypothetical protein
VFFTFAARIDHGLFHELVQLSTAAEAPDLRGFHTVLYAAELLVSSVDFGYVTELT